VVRIAAAVLIVLSFAPPAPAVPQIIVAVGDPSPLSLPFSRFSDPALDDHGRVAFIGANAALFRRSGETLVHVIGAGDALGGHVVAGIGAPALGAEECLAFRATFQGGGTGIFMQCGGSPKLVADNTTIAPGGAPFAGFSDEVAVGAGGGVAFIGVLLDGTAVLVLADADGTLREITRTGAASPAGGTFTGFRLVGVSATGDVGFRGVVTAGPDGLFQSDGTAVAKIAVVGDASPAGGGFTAVNLANMNDAGVCVFRGVVSSGPRQGVFRFAPGTNAPLTVVALEGDAAPMGGTFKQFPSSLVPAVNTTGAVAFRATISGAPFSSGVFVVPPGGAPSQVVAVGEPTAVGTLVRLRDVEIGDDGSVLVRASVARGGKPGLFRAQNGEVSTVAAVGDTTDLGDGFRFADASVRATVDTAVFLGLREALFVADPSGDLQAVARVGDQTPLGGQYAALDPPAAGNGRIVIGASIVGGRAAEALLLVGRRRPRVLARTNEHVGKHLKLSDLFADPIDNLERASVGGGGVAFQSGLSGGSSASGIVVARNGHLSAIAREGQNTPGGGRYREFGTPAAFPAGAAFVAVGTTRTSALFLAAAGTSRLIAASETETGTRLHGTFQAFDTPAASGRTIAFKATLDHGAREGVFAARGRCVMALAATGEAEPGGGHFKGFSIPTFAGQSVVFRATTLGGTTTTAVYRSSPSHGCTQVPPSIDVLTVAGAAAPRGGMLLGFGSPSGSRRGDVAFTADLTGAGGGDAIVYVP